MTTDLTEVVGGLAQRFGFRFNPEHPTPLQNALQRRAQTLRLLEPMEYVHLLRQDAGEWSRLAEQLTIHETSFYRHSGQFRALSSIILPELIRLRAAKRALRLWSAACSTGEEAYSLAIAILQQNLSPDWKIEILATDLSSRALQLAERAVFDERHLRNLPTDWVMHYFEPYNGQYRLRDEVRSLVSFQSFNLAQTTPLPEVMREMDVVFCENVLIYLHPEAVQQAVNHLRTSLSENGYLFLGYAETLYNMSEGFVALSFGDAYVYRRTGDEDQSKAEGGKGKDELSPFPRRASPPPLSRRPVSLPPSRSATQLPRSSTPRLPSSAATAVCSTQEVEALIDRGDLAGATNMAECWLNQEAEAVPPRYLLARLYAAQGQLPRAADRLRELLTRDALHAPSYTLLGILCYQQGEIAEATTQFQHALYLEPKSPLAYFYLGNIHQQRQEIRSAIHDYRNALQTAEHLTPSWDSSFTPEVLVQVCQRNIGRLEKMQREL